MHLFDRTHVNSSLDLNTVLTFIPLVNRTICVFTATGEHVHTIGPLAGPVLGLEWRKGGEIAVNIGIAICIFNVDDVSFTPGPQYSADQAALTVLASAPNGKMLAAGCNNGSVSSFLC